MFNKSSRIFLSLSGNNFATKLRAHHQVLYLCFLIILYNYSTNKFSGPVNLFLELPLTSAVVETRSSQFIWTKIMIERMFSRELLQVFIYFRPKRFHFGPRTTIQYLSVAT